MTPNSREDLKKATNLVSRILFLCCHLSCAEITFGIMLPTPGLERATLITTLYMALQHPRFTHVLHYCGTS